MRDRLFEFSPVPREIILPDDLIAEQRILSTVQLATPAEQEAGCIWYFNANKLCKNLANEYRELNLNYEHIAGIIAVLSPMRSWDQNLDNAISILKFNSAKTLGYAEKSAQKIRAGEHPESVFFSQDRNNPKVRSFYYNISQPETSMHVTIDRHMWNLLFDDLEIVKKAGLYFKSHEYEWAEERFKAVANQLGCIPHQVQATTWVRQRKLLGIDKSEHSTDYIQEQLELN